MAPLVTSASWSIRELNAPLSTEAGDLITGILASEFPDAVGICQGDDTSHLYQSYCGPGHAAWVGIVADRVVGVAATGEQDSGALALRRLYVHADWRGTGLAEALLDAFHGWAIAGWYQELVLTTHETMRRAQRFYEQNGYVLYEDGETPGGTLHQYRRITGVRDTGSRLPLDVVPDARDGLIPVVIERPRRLVEAWHYDAELNDLVLSGTYPVALPVNYGFTTAWENPADGDYLDVIVLDDRLMYPGETMLCRATGVLWRNDGDHKLLVVPIASTDQIDHERTYSRISSWWNGAFQLEGTSGSEGLDRLWQQCRER
jgi:GNAT superfamily N-acetyltransferase/inorganic pyrophosphatase